MKRIIITTALALAIAAPAVASDQLARSLGVEPGAFTAAELATIKGVREGGVSTDRETANVFAGLFSRGVVSTQSVGASGQRAAGPKPRRGRRTASPPPNSRRSRASPNSARPTTPTSSARSVGTAASSRP
jgi:hypothetical protein